MTDPPRPVDAMRDGEMEVIRRIAAGADWNHDVANVNVRRLLATLDAARSRLGDCDDALTTVEQAYERETDVERLAEAMHDAMCDISHHDRPPARCSKWARYPMIAASVAERLAR